MVNPSRVPPGVPAGGQFAHTSRTESPEALIMPEAQEMPLTEIEVANWRRLGFPRRSAQAWAAAGYRSPSVADRWVRCGFTPETAREWEDAGRPVPPDFALEDNPPPPEMEDGSPYWAASQIAG